MNQQQSRFIFLGDCNTCGADGISGSSYPELVAANANATVLNLGLTMSTTREGIEFSNHHALNEYDAIFVQYGLVDSWVTLRSAPYVLYYPDNFFRRRLRALVKKWKKYGRKLGLGKVFGVQNQVPLDEYRGNIESIIAKASGKPVYLIETPPNKDKTRNPAIRRYNASLLELSESHVNTHCIRIYSNLDNKFDTHYCDPTHLSDTGHALVATKISDYLNKATSSYTAQ